MPRFHFNAYIYYAQLLKFEQIFFETNVKIFTTLDIKIDFFLELEMLFIIYNFFIKILFSR